jgi:hypothetical protein
MDSVFTSDECNLLAQALDVAWEICIQSGDLERRNIDLTKAVLTRAILSGYENGERNTRRLAITAVAQLDAPRRQFGIAPSAKPAA